MCKQFMHSSVAYDVAGSRQFVSLLTAGPMSILNQSARKTFVNIFCCQAHAAENNGMAAANRLLICPLEKVNASAKSRHFCSGKAHR